MNETLEAMTRVIFDDWFVDFGPIRARTEGRELYLAPKVWRLFPDEFACCLARSSRFREFAIRSMTGTGGRQRAPAAALSKFVLPVPPTPVAAAFGRVVRPLLARAGKAVRESASAAATRDAPLPRPMSGRLRLRDAEKVAA